MQLNLKNMLLIECRCLSDAAWWARHHECPGDLQDEGETIAHVSGSGRITDLDGHVVIIEPIKPEAQRRA